VSRAKITLIWNSIFVTAFFKTYQTYLSNLSMIYSYASDAPNCCKAVKIKAQHRFIKRISTEIEMRKSYIWACETTVLHYTVFSFSNSTTRLAHAWVCLWQTVNFLNLKRCTVQAAWLPNDDHGNLSASWLRTRCVNSLWLCAKFSLSRMRKRRLSFFFLATKRRVFAALHRASFPGS